MIVELSVLVQQTGSNFRAWCEQPLSASAEGATREEALTKLRDELVAKTRGVEVAKLTLPIAELESDPLGTLGDEQSDSPQAIAAWIATFDAIPPLTMTPAEEAAWKADRHKQKDIDAAAFDRLLTTLPGPVK